VLVIDHSGASSLHLLLVRVQMSLLYSGAPDGRPLYPAS
jgi:hypothetical protein